MKKLYWKFRVAELHAVLIYIDDLDHRFNFTEPDVLGVMEDFASWLSRMSVSVRREQAKSRLKEMDHLRDLAFSSFDHLLQGYAGYPERVDPLIREAGQHCYRIILDYLGTADESYYISTSNIDSLLYRFSQPDNAASLARLPYAPVFLDELALRQSDFCEAQADYTEQRTTCVESPSSLLQPITRFMNSIFLPLIAIKARLNPEVYGDYATQLNDIITRANSLARHREE